MRFVSLGLLGLGLWLGLGAMTTAALRIAPPKRAARQQTARWCSAADKAESSLPLEPKIPPPPSVANAFLLLNGVAVIWGSQHALVKGTLDSFPTSSLNFWRFLSSALLFSPALVGVLSTKDQAQKNLVLRGGAELGLYTFLGFAFQSIGLETTTASRSAFLLYLNVKFVPFLSAFLYQRAIPASVWASAALALTGTYLLSTDGTNSSSFNTGDAWCIAAALASAFFILRLETIAQGGVKASELTSISSATVATLCALWVTADTFQAANPSDGDIWQQYLVAPVLENPWAPLYLGAITTSLCGYLQTLGQKVIPAERASIIYSLDPLYGAAFSAYFLHEQFGPSGAVGGLFILAGVALSSLAAGNKEVA